MKALIVALTLFASVASAERRDIKFKSCNNESAHIVVSLSDMGVFVASGHVGELSFVADSGCKIDVLQFGNSDVSHITTITCKGKLGGSRIATAILGSADGVLNMMDIEIPDVNTGRGKQSNQRDYLFCE